MIPTLAASPLVTADIQHQQISQALRPRVMSANLAAVFGQPHLTGARHGTPVCHILDMRYEPGEQCAILYQLGERLVLGRLDWMGASGEVPDTAQVVAPLGMRAYLFPHDPALPGLVAALESAGMARLLAETLPECRSDAAQVLRCQVTPLRYRPGRRCLLRLEAWLRDARTGAITARTLFGKVYHDAAKAASVYEQMRLLSDSAPARDGRVGLAGAVAFLPDLPLILQEPVAGAPLTMLLGRMTGTAATGDSRGWSGVLRAATALAALHTTGLAVGRQRSIAAELARFEYRATKVALVNPTLGARLSELATTLPAWLERLPAWGAEIGLVHGDCKPSQFLIGPTQVAVLDFDHCGMADPATDVGTFMATLRQLGVRQWLKALGSAAAVARLRWLEALEQRFLDEYCAASDCSPDFRLRAVWYEAVALVRKALRSFARSPFSPLPAKLVDEAWLCLAALPF